MPKSWARACAARPAADTMDETTAMHDMTGMHETAGKTAALRGANSIRDAHASCPTVKDAPT
jgi:hypothetical protein